MEDNPFTFVENVDTPSTVLSTSRLGRLSAPRRIRSEMTSLNGTPSPRSSLRPRRINTSLTRQGATNPTAFTSSPQASVSSNGDASKFNYDSDEDAKAEHDDLEASRLQKKASPSSSPKSGSTDAYLTPSTPSPTYEHALDDGSVTRPRRTSSVSSVESFRSTVEPLEDTAAKLKETCFKLIDTTSSLDSIKQRVSELEKEMSACQNKLDDAVSAKSLLENLHAEEISKLHERADVSCITHTEHVDKLRQEISALQIQTQEAAAALMDEKLKWSTRVADLQSAAYETAENHAEATRKLEIEISKLEVQMKQAEKEFEEKNAILLESSSKRERELESAITAAEKDLDTKSKELEKCKAELYNANKDLGRLQENHAQLLKNNDNLIENNAFLRKQQQDGEDVSTLATLRMSEISEERQKLSQKLESIKVQLEKVLSAHEDLAHESTALKEGLQKRKSTEMNELLDALRELARTNLPQANIAETEYLQARVKDLKEAYETEREAASSLFKENGFFMSQICKLQADLQAAEESRTSADVRMANVLSHKESVVIQNAVLSAQLVELRPFLKFAQDQSSRRGYELVGHQESAQSTTTIETAPIAPKTQVKEEVPDPATAEKNSQLQLEVDRLQKLLEKKESALHSCQAQLTSSESDIHRLNESLEKQQLANKCSRTELTSVKKKLQLSAEETVAHLEKVSTLEEHIELREPLVQAGIFARRLWWERARQFRALNGDWLNYPECGTPDRAFISSAIQRSSRPDYPADTALFFLGILSDDHEHNMFGRIYDNPVQRDIRAATKPAILAEIRTMTATLEDRNRHMPYGAPEFAGEDEFHRLSEECSLEYGRKISRAGLDPESGREERAAVTDVFDNDGLMQDNLSRMKEIFDGAMKQMKPTKSSRRRRR